MSRIVKAGALGNLWGPQYTAPTYPAPPRDPAEDLPGGILTDDMPDTPWPDELSALSLPVKSAVQYAFENNLVPGLATGTQAATTTGGVVDWAMKHQNALFIGAGCVFGLAALRSIFR